jgi:energy-coupling factor transporter ATP-binding protein EcfA2
MSWAFRDVWESLYSPINLLFIDELIDNGLDTQGVENALALLKKMSRERHKSIWLVSHRDELAGRVENILKVIKENGFTSYNTDVDSVVFCGCSYTKGCGQIDPNLWVNILHRSIPELSNKQLINAGVDGATNEDIFLSALDTIINKKCSYLFVAFTQPKRVWVNPSVETYSNKNLC